jgi:hypothetical protein
MLEAKGEVVPEQAHVGLIHDVLLGAPRTHDLLAIAEAHVVVMEYCTCAVAWTGEQERKQQDGSVRGVCVYSRILRMSSSISFSLRYEAVRFAPVHLSH